MVERLNLIHMKRALMIVASISLTICGIDIYMNSGHAEWIIAGGLCLSREIYITFRPEEKI